MRRFGKYLLLFFGVFFLVFSAVVKFVVAPAAVKAPLSIPAKYSKVIASGNGFNYFDASTGHNVKINVWITRTIIGDVAAGNSKVAVYDESLCLTRDTDGSHPGCVDKFDPQHRLITNSTDRVAFDRKSGAAVDDPKYGANVDGNRNITHQGLSYKFPIDTKKQQYLYFDTVVGKAFPMKYADTEKLAGLTVYRFVQNMVNQPAYTNNTFPSTYTNLRTVWVEPTAGVIVKGQEQLKQVLTGREALGPTSKLVEPGLAGIVALEGTLTFTLDTVRLQAQLAKDNLPKIHLVRLWLPLIAVILGLLLLGAAVLLFRAQGRGRDPRHAAGEPPPPSDSEPGADPESDTDAGPGRLFEPADS